MPRMMSFALTTEQFKNRTKDVTRRNGWWKLKPGDVLMGVEKAQGLKKGEHVVKLGLIRVKSTEAQYLHSITQEDCVREGFPEHSPTSFTAMYCLKNKCQRTTTVNRIEFEYLDTEPDVNKALWTIYHYVQSFDLKHEMLDEMFGDNWLEQWAELAYAFDVVELSEKKTATALEAGQLLMFGGDDGNG